MVKIRRCCLLCLKWMKGLKQDCAAAPTAFYSPPPVFQVRWKTGNSGKPGTMDSQWNLIGIVDCLCWTWIFGNFVPRVVFFGVILLVLSPNLTPVDMFFFWGEQKNALCWHRDWAWWTSMKDIRWSKDALIFEAWKDLLLATYHFRFRCSLAEINHFRTRWWFQILFIFHPYLGKMNPFWRAYVSKWVETQPPTMRTFYDMMFFLIFRIHLSNYSRFCFKSIHTLQGTNISPKNGILKMIFLFPRWDMLVPWRVPFIQPLGHQNIGNFLSFCQETVAYRQGWLDWGGRFPKDFRKVS